MSNSRRVTPKPPREAAVYARAYRCGHCTGKGRLRRKPDRYGIWHIEVAHDGSCPILTGTVSVAGAGRRAMAAMAKITGTTGLYIGPEEQT